jgi:hypothetical protein
LIPRGAALATNSVVSTVAAASGPAGLRRSGAPIFVLCSGRSGSTLLRFLLDAHPAIAVPAETNVGPLLVSLERLWSLLEQSGSADMSDMFRARAHELLDDSFGEYVARKGKQRWCDKSLGTAQVATFLADLLPSAQFICLFRRWRDVVTSGLDACPWGLHGYGFEPFGARFPANQVHALAAYWLEHTQSILAAESQVGADRCIRLRYEDLVADPVANMNRVFEFLGERGLTRTQIEEAFRTEHDDGPSDHKIWYTSGIKADSIGKGDSIPVEMVPPPLAAQLEEIEAMLGYAPCSAGGAAEEEAGHPASPGLVAGETTAGRSDETEPAGGWLEDAEPEAMALSKVLDGLLAAAGFNALVRERGEAATVRVVVAYGPPGRGRTLRFGCPDEGTSAGGQWHASATAPVWRKVLNDEINPGSLLRRGDLRYDSADTAEADQSVVRARLAMLLRALSPHGGALSEPEAQLLAPEFETAIR